MLFPRPQFDDVLAALDTGRDTTAHFVREAVDAQYGEFPEGLHPRLREALAAQGIERPYTHQQDAIDVALRGEHLVLTTPTASGKTLCYNAPVLHQLIKEPEARALYLFPTKALSQDQYTSVHALIESAQLPFGTFTFDGDTPADARRAVRDHGHIVITNPDMLHAGVLPQHTKWVKLFENLRYVVIDELHTYRGIFGSHVAHVIHRLRRICAFYGSSPQFICCSATIANPVELAETLTGLKYTHVEKSGAPRGEHHLVCYNPPVVNAQLGIRAGVVRSTFRITRDLMAANVATIIFAGSRLNVEILLKYLREAQAKAKQPTKAIQGYRGGYLPKHRRRIEAGLRDGSVRCVVATNALELGIDIGRLDACVIAGYPGSIASLWQQSGRAGRRSGRSLTVLVARSSALDQFLITHPESLLGRSPEHARVNPRNLFVLVDHAKCAAFELPFQPDEAYGMLSVEETQEILGYLSQNGVLHESEGQFHWTERVFPAHQVNLRGVPEQNFVVIDEARDRILAEVDFRSAHTTLHTHAIYHVDSHQYQVERLDYENHKAYVRRVDPDYYTTALTYTRVAVLDEDQSVLQGGTAVCQGEVRVSTKVVGFKKVKFHTNENVGYGDVFLPDLEMHTTSCWFTLAGEAFAALPYERDTVIDGLVALSHALKLSAAVVLMCATRDLGRVVGDRSAGVSVPIGSFPKDPSKGSRRQDFDPTVFFYDAMPGGVGLSEAFHKDFGTILSRAMTLLSGCDCDGGCPSCVGAMPIYDGGAKVAALGIGAFLGGAPTGHTP